MIDFKKQWKKLVIVYNVIDILAVLLFYPIIPKILNYPPNSINNSFQMAINGLTYTQQYVSIILLCVFIENIILFVTYKKITKQLNQINNSTEKNAEVIYIKAEKNIERTPAIIYILQVVAPVIAIILTFGSLKGNIEVILKVSLVFFAMLLSIATISYTLCKNIFKDILINLFYRINENKKIEKKVFNKIKRTTIKSSVIFIVIPLLIITIVFITFIGYGALTRQKGDLLYEKYNNELSQILNENYNSIEEIKARLSEVDYNSENDSFYIITNTGDIYTSNNKYLSEFFIKYQNEISKTQKQKNRTYDFYATDEQGVFDLININNKTYTVGIKYLTSATDMIKIILVVSIIIIILSIILLIYSLNYVFRDIELVTNKLNKMSKSKKIDLNDKLPISGNNEISDLVKAFSNIQEKTNEYVEQIDQDKYTMERQAQFSILGEFAGGLAHDLNSPLCAVKLDIGTLRKYINSDKISANDNIKEKLNEIFANIDSSLGSMGNTIEGVRNQIRATGDTQSEEFLLIDVIEGIKILFRSIFMKNNCQLEVQIPSDLKIYGERNKLDRTIGNLIKNSIDAYVEKGIKGIVTVGAKQDKEKTLIYVEDKAGGIDKDIQEKIFKEIKTTKNEKGTGFGLYYSNTMIESSFKGKMYFETEKNVGTTFYIELPNKKKEENING